MQSETLTAIATGPPMARPMGWKVIISFVVLASSAPGIAGTSRQATARPATAEAGQLGRVALSSESSASAVSPAEVPNGSPTAAVAQAGGRVDTSTWGQLLALLGFLLLIAGVLIHWSRDTSYQDERSVFSAPP